MNGFSTTGSQLIDTVAKGLRWLDRQIAQIVTPPAPRQRMPAEMSDIQLQQDINDVGAVLMNGLQDIIKGSFVGDAAHGDLRFPHKNAYERPGPDADIVHAGPRRVRLDSSRA